MFETLLTSDKVLREKLGEEDKQSNCDVITRRLKVSLCDIFGVQELLLADKNFNIDPKLDQESKMTRVLIGIGENIIGIAVKKLLIF